MGQILQSHGRLGEWVKFSELNKSYDILISHHLNEQEYGTALSLLKKLALDAQCEFLYKHCHVLMRHQPEETFKLLEALEKKEKEKEIKPIDHARLIPGLMNIPKEKRDCAIIYLVSFPRHELTFL
jgi:hypothetical protein